jgi:hypothetical protein
MAFKHADKNFSNTYKENRSSSLNSLTYSTYTSTILDYKDKNEISLNKNTRYRDMTVGLYKITAPVNVFTIMLIWSVDSSDLNVDQKL